jgi:hypothetical protein
MTEQTKALRLADELEGRFPISGKEAAAELRRLHAANAEMLGALRYVLEDDDLLPRATAKTRAVVRAAIAKATGETK